MRNRARLALAPVAAALAGMPAAASDIPAEQPTPGPVATVLVLRSTGPSASRFPAGLKIPVTAKIVLVAGDVIVLLDSRGARTLTGPGTFAAVPQTGVAGTLGALMGSRSERRARIGAVRATSDPEPAPTVATAPAKPEPAADDAQPANPVMPPAPRARDATRPDGPPRAATAPPPHPPVTVETCAFGSDALCDRIAAALRRLRRARAYVAAPDRVAFDTPFKLELRVDPTGLVTPGDVRADNRGARVSAYSVPYSYTMSATLEGSPTFAATPDFAEARQIVLPFRPSSWSWSVRAVRPDPRPNPIIVRLFAHLTVNGRGGDPVEIEVLRQPMQVEMSIWSRARAWLAEAEGISKALATIVAAAAAAMAWVAGRRWLPRRRKAVAKRPDPGRRKYRKA